MSLNRKNKFKRLEFFNLERQLLVRKVIKLHSSTNDRERKNNLFSQPNSAKVD